MAKLGVLPLVVLQCIALILIVIAWLQAVRLARSTPTGVKPLPLLLGIGTLFVALATLLSGAALLQEKTGRSLGVSGGIASDARAWIQQHPKRPANRSEVGDNIRVLGDAVVFLKTHQPQLSPTGVARLDELSRTPEKPRRLLTVSEETIYFQAAESGYTYISQLAGTAQQ